MQGRQVRINHHPVIEKKSDVNANGAVSSGFLPFYVDNYLTVPLMFCVRAYTLFTNEKEMPTQCVNMLN
jgi:hypothetical protein